MQMKIAVFSLFGIMILFGIAALFLLVGSIMRGTSIPSEIIVPMAFAGIIASSTGVAIAILDKRVSDLERQAADKNQKPGEKD
jgi:hypothetical protein